jgi:hypothetical protein
MGQYISWLYGDCLRVLTLSNALAEFFGLFENYWYIR